MTDALIVNPYSVEETAEVIRDALEMSQTERCERHAALLAGVQKHDVAAWSHSFLEHLKRVSARPQR
jgi:trehalose 6-phosphate synthase